MIDECCSIVSIKHLVSNSVLACIVFPNSSAPEHHLGGISKLKFVRLTHSDAKGFGGCACDTKL